ncbi:MAG: molybdopterin-guanine dinucleotide biosynthesis protein B [Anaerolineae bacterium]|jgi:molybdopterin-guanine dinucleotide biosynthesis protein MobB
MKPEIPVVSIVGHSGSGKTTLLEKLVHELKRRGYRLAVVKHHHHRDLPFDTPGKDSWRFSQAGADHVVLAGPDKVAHLRYFEQEPTLEQVTAAIQNVDLILTEGYKRANSPKIEVCRGKTEATLISSRAHLVAIISDRDVNIDLPRFDVEDVAAVARFIEERFLAQP